VKFIHLQYSDNVP